VGWSAYRFALHAPGAHQVAGRVHLLGAGNGQAGQGVFPVQHLVFRLAVAVVGDYLYLRNLFQRSYVTGQGQDVCFFIIAAGYQRVANNDIGVDLTQSLQVADNPLVAYPGQALVFCGIDMLDIEENLVRIATCLKNRRPLCIPRCLEGSMDASLAASLVQFPGEGRLVQWLASSQSHATA